MSTRTYDVSGLTPAMRGRLEKHLGQLVRVDGVVMTRREAYASPDYVSKHAGLKWNADYTARTPWYFLDTADDRGTEVPKLVFDTIELPDTTERVA